jgi:hypothetical protein
MNSSPSAGDALLYYIDSLLFDMETRSDVSGERPTADCMENEPAGNKAVPDEHSDIEVLHLQNFKAAGIPLAISLDSISEIVAVKSTDLKNLQLERGVLHGTLNYHGRDIRILDMRDIILPAEHPYRRKSLDEGTFYVLLLSGGAYGLLCDDVGECVDVARRNVAWCGQRASRAWLAGMVKESNHALLDEAQLIQVLDKI